MKRPRVRYTVRRLMVGVAVMALVFEVESGRRRYPYCRSNAARCASAEKVHLWMADNHERISALFRKHAAEARGSVRYANEQAALFARASGGERAKAKDAAGRGAAFRRAALFPWVAIPPEEAEPMGVGRPDRGE